MVDYKKQGKQNRAKGLAFELKTRKELEKMGFIVNKWSQNVDLKKGIMHPARNKYIPRKGLMPGLGFPDFVTLMKTGSTRRNLKYRHNVRWVECKTNNTLSKEEKLKLNWMLEQGYDCWIAYQDEETKEVKFRKFVEYVPGRRVCRKKATSHLR